MELNCRHITKLASYRALVESENLSKIIAYFFRQS